MTWDINDRIQTSSIDNRRDLFQSPDYHHCHITSGMIPQRQEKASIGREPRADELTAA